MNHAIEQLIDKHGPAKICETLATMMTAERIARIDEVLAARLGSLAAAVEDTYDPHNAAATIRTSEALGLQDLHVIHGEAAFSTVKAITKGAHQWIELHKWTSPEAAVSSLRARGFRVLATTPDAPHSIDDVDVSTPLVVLFGNEHAGLTEAALAASDGAVSVPMHGFTESFNLSVTVALAMSRLAARRRAHLGATGDLDPARLLRLRARWFTCGIRAADEVLQRLLA